MTAPGIVGLGFDGSTMSRLGTGFGDRGSGTRRFDLAGTYPPPAASTSSALSLVLGGGNDILVIDSLRSTTVGCRFRDEVVIFRRAERRVDLLIGIEAVQFQDATVPQAMLDAAQLFQYLATYDDLAAGFGADEVAGWRHFAITGLAEGRSIGFSGLGYIASYVDLCDPPRPLPDEHGRRDRPE